MLKFAKEYMYGPMKNTLDGFFNEASGIATNLAKEHSELNSLENDEKAKKKKQEKKASYLELEAVPVNRFHYKVADISGAAPNMQFEEAFQRLAYEYVRGQAPGLFDYVMGFQVLDTNEEKTEAFGVYGFKVGEEWLYTPVFFLNGNLKGNVLLYIKGQNRFVPLSDNWFNVILQEQSIQQGQGTKDSLSSLNAFSPDMLQITRPPRYYKYSSVLPDSSPKHKKFAAMMENLKDDTYLPALKYANIGKMSKFASVKQEWNLNTYLTKYASICKQLVGILDSSPVLRVAYDRYHGDSDILIGALEHHVKTAASNTLDFAIKETKYTTDGTGFSLGNKTNNDNKVKVIIETPDTVKHYQFYTDLQRTNISSKGYTTIDGRKDDKINVIIRQGDLNVQTPTIPGIYHVVMIDGSLRRCAVIPAVVPSDTTRTPSSMIIDVENKNYCVAPQRDILTIGGADPDSCYKKWWDELSDSDAITKADNWSEDSKQNVVLNSSGCATLPFSIDKDSGNMKKSYHVWWHKGPYDSSYDFGSAESKMPEYISFNSSPMSERFVVTSNILYAPKNSKTIHVKYESDFSIGDLTVIQQLTTKTASALNVYKEANYFYLDQKPYTKLAAVKTLIEGYNFREKDAEEILDSVSTLDKNIYYLKQADIKIPGDTGLTAPSGIIDSSIVRPTEFEDPMIPGATLQEPVMSMQTVQGERAQDYNPDGRNSYPLLLPDPLEKQQLLSAANTGKADLFDAKMLETMVKHSDEGDVIQETVPVLEKAIDKLGVLLMQLYWRHDAYEERFGKVDTPDLENNIIISFKNLGDLCLFLRTKNVTPASSLLFNSNLLDTSQNS